ncbi:glucose-6-phosphate isomerase [Qingshengfaniella alkalisoli]|uniref:Glucose-6-phosphate isomerase n=1 Tax=Qingshengfaniella alkalisoli TaxID=2599296 RepID=A0A5B8IQI8_9RHOB|nr:glucose-6-phosphate isomerase [Qingshengfaniella alkalisoli]QDY68512.1 glucose-6-phosphate isomerase [Qingshengfaniella alkalisoli]
MRSVVISTALAASLAVSACEDQRQQDMIGTGLASAAIAAIAANAIASDPAWTIAAAAAAGAAGALYARNRDTNECAYHSGDGETVYVRDCPET